MSAEPRPLSRDDQLLAAVRAALAKRLHAMADAALDDLMADVMLALAVPELTDVQSRLPAL